MNLKQQKFQLGYDVSWARNFVIEQWPVFIGDRKSKFGQQVS